MAVLIFKQGNSESSSLAYAEPLFHTDSNTLILSGSVSEYVNTEVSPSINSGSLYRLTLTDYPNTGSLIVTGDFSGSNLLLDGNATIRGNITMGGSGLDFGDASDDNVVFKADISSSIIPNDTGQFDLGSDSQRWRSLYQSGALDIQGGPIDLHSDTYISASSGTFTHLDVGSYLDIDVAGNTTFDGQGTLSVSSSGALKIDSPTSIGIGTNSDAPIDIDSTTLDIDASGALTIDSATSISIGTTADKPIDIDSTTLDIDSSGAITINGESTTAISSSGALSIDSETGINIGTTTDKPIDIDSSTLDIDASGAITIDGTSTFSVDVSGDANINSTGTGAITIGTNDGHIDIDASSSGKVSIDGAQGIDIGVAADTPIDIDSTTLDIDSSGAITINGESTTAISSSGTLSIDSETTINIGTTTDKPIDIDASTLDIDASGTLTIDSATAIDIGTNADKPINVDSTTFDLDASGNITLDSTTGINVGTATSGVPISIGHTTSETTINDNLTVTGNFTVNGTTTYVSSSNVTIGDRIIELNYLGASGNGGLYVGDADGTSTSGSLLWDSTNDYWIAGAKDLEHKILLQNGDSIISGSGTNNQITTFTGTHGVDSSANLTFDGSNLRVTGTQEITGNLSGSSSGSFKNINVAESQIVGNDLYVGGTIFHKDDTDTKIVLTDDDINITVGNTNMIDFTQDTVSEITINEAAQNLDVRIEGEADNKLFFTDASVSKIGIGTNTPGEKLTIHGNVSGSASGSFKNILVEKTITSDSGSFGRVVGSIGATNGVVSGSSQIDHDATTNFVANEHIDHSTITIGSGQGLSGGGTINVSRSLTLDTGSSHFTEGVDKRLTSLNAATGSYLTSSGSVAFSDITSKPGYLVGKLVPGNNVTITSGSDTLTIEASAGGGGGGTISGSSQIDHDATTNFVAAEHFLQSAITTVGTVTTGNVQAILPSGTVSGSAQIDGSALGSNKTITISGTSVTLGGSITDETLFGGTDVLSGSLLPGTNVTINSSSDGYFISSSAAGGGANDATITLTAGTGLTGGGDFTTNQAGNESITFNFDSSAITGSFLRKLGDGVVSGSAQVDKTLQQVTAEGASTNVATTFSNTTDSTSKTTGALIVGGGVGINNTLNVGGDVVAFASSDERLKDNIKPIENPLDIISKISGNTFDWNSEKQDIYNGKDYGVIAQEIKEVMPELVDTRDSGYLAVKYDKIVPLLIESIKELKREIEELKSK